jgi:hypothetical protein
MRALSGKKEPDKVADALHYHGDVRRMLLTMRAVAEGGRAMLYHAAQLADFMTEGVLTRDEKKREFWDDKLGFFTPILKGFLTEIGYECANLGMQVFGGHGYIKEHGMEQIVRDARIATLYEGTTGVQALDLLGRKVLMMTKGKAVQEFTGTILKLCAQLGRDKQTLPFALSLGKYAAQWNYATVRLMLIAARDRDMVSSACYDYLMYSGYITMGYFWALIAHRSVQRLKHGGSETPEFYRTKIETAEFYFQRLLPRAKAHLDAMLAPAASVMKTPIENFQFA